MTTSRLTYVEARAGIAAAGRAGRVDLARMRLAHEYLDDLWNDVEVVELDPTSTALAAQVAEDYGLRAGDAIHLASALILDEDELVFLTSDRRLRAAAVEAGLTVSV